MPNNEKHEGRFEPIHDAHAIEQVLFVVQVEQPLDDDNFQKVREAAEQFKSELPGRAELKSFSFAIGGVAPVGPIPSAPTIGTAFSRMAPDGTIESEFRIERASVTFRTSRYTRWDDVWEAARKYLDPVISQYVAQARISGISLNFVDKFIWVGTISACRPALILRPGSDYICPHVYCAEDLWHSHTGAFLQVDDQTKRLININADCIDESVPQGPRRVLAIRTVLTDLMNQPGFAPLEIGRESAAEVVNIHMQQLHGMGKTIFGKVINDMMCKRIALSD